MKKTDLAWMASIIDGEGCISVQVNRQLWIQVGMTHLPTMERIHSLFGGALRNHAIQDVEWKPRFLWVITNSRAIDLLEKILPYMTTKRDEAEVAVTLRDTFNTGHYLTVEQEALRQSVRIELQRMKAIRYKPLEGRITQEKTDKKEKAS